MVKRINEYKGAKPKAKRNYCTRSEKKKDFRTRREDSSDKENKKEGQIGKRSCPCSPKKSKNSKNFDPENQDIFKKVSPPLKKLKVMDVLVKGEPKKLRIFGKVDAKKLKEFVNDTLLGNIDSILGEIEAAKIVSKTDFLKKLTFLDTEIKEFIANSSCIE